MPAENTNPNNTNTPFSARSRHIKPPARLVQELGPVTYTAPVLPNSLWHDERAVRDKFRIHYADLDPAVGSTRLFAVARNARIGFAKTLGAHDCRGNSGLHQEVADSFCATL